MKNELTSGIKLNQIEYFCEVCRLGSFSKAAYSMGVSQPTVSEAVKKLEARLDSQLIERSGSFQLTEKGRIVFEHCSAILDQLSRMEARLKDADHPGTDSIHFGSCATEDVIMEDIRSFLQTHQSANIILETRNMAVMPELILGDHFDLAVLPAGAISSGMLSLPYKKTEFGLLLPPGHQLIELDEVEPRLLEDEIILLPPFQESLSPAISEYAEARGLKLKLSPALMARNFQTLRFLVNEGCGIGFFPLPNRKISLSEFPEDKRFTRRLKDPLYIDFSLAWKKDKFLSSAMRELIAHLCKKQS